MNLSKKSPTKGAASLQRSAGAKGRPEPLDQRLWKHVGGGDYPPAGPSTKHDPHH
ncbi:RaxX family RiPP [Xanthomonas oryzae]|uniref:RaxX family RiPP n=1 Tax=Xanthomonas oryzae TaxID=347 RepID=UPI0002D57749|nr:RaxX family RiPP [Xanthomonas oryzae]